MDEKNLQRAPSWEMYPRESARLLGLLFAWAAHGPDAVGGDGSSPGVNDVRRWLMRCFDVSDDGGGAGKSDGAGNNGHGKLKLHGFTALIYLPLQRPTITLW